MMLDTRDEVEVEQFWKRFLRKYEQVCNELDLDPDSAPIEQISDGLERLAHQQGG
jgi:hypothetical protein